MDEIRQDNVSRSPPSSPPAAADSTTTTDIKKLTEKLVQQVNEYSRGNASKLEASLHILKRKRLRHASSANIFLRHGGLESLLQLQRRRQSAETTVGTAVEQGRLETLVWSIIANLCALSGQAQTQVIQLAMNDISSILSYSAHSPQLLNAVSRTVGNIVSHSEFRSNTHSIVQSLSRIASTVRDPSCIQSVLRTLRKTLTAHPSAAESFAANQTISIVANWLNTNDSGVSLTALGVMEACITGGHIDLLSTLWSYEHNSLSLIISHTRVEATRSKAVSILCFCTRHVDGRAAVSRAGGIEVLVQFLSSSLSGEENAQAIELIEALCRSCRDVHSRQRIRDCNGLELLVGLLRKDEYSLIHQEILSALICYYFDEQTLRFMIRRLGLMKSLIHHLNSSMTHHYMKDANTTGNPLALATTADKGPDICIDFDTGGSEVALDFGRVSDTCIDHENESGINIDAGKRDSQDYELSSQTNDIPSLSPPPNFSDCELSPPCSNITAAGSPLYSPNESSPIIHSTCTPVVSPLHLMTEDSPLDDSSCPNELATPTSQVSVRSRVTLEVNTSTPMPANFIDSLLSSPSLYGSLTPLSSLPSVTSSPVTSHVSSTNDRVLMLLSRVSHLHDCHPVLASPDSLNVLIDYFLSSGSVDVHCFKVLGRLFANPHCFQDCITTLAPSLIFHHMIRNTEDGNQEENSKQYLCNSKSSSCAADRRGLCQQLLDKLSRVAVSPYGQGVIAHMLLRGDTHDVMASTLSLILLERSYAICHKMLTTYCALNSLFLLAQGRPIITTCDCNTEDNNPSTEDANPSTEDTNPRMNSITERQQNELIQLLSIDTLLYLARHYFIHPGRKRTHYSIEKNDSLSPASKRLKSLAPPLTPPLAPPLVVTRQCHCRYRDYDHWPFDMNICLDCGSVFPVHRAMIMELSDVFAVMLSGPYQESTSDTIQLHKVCPVSFESLLHHAYGCGFDCTTHTAVNTASESNDLISEIVSTVDDKESARHCLMVLVCANQFNVSPLVNRCQRQFVKFLNPGNILCTFLFSQLHQSSCLSEECIKYLISMRPSQEQSELCLQLLNSQESNKCIQMIYNIFNTVTH